MLGDKRAKAIGHREKRILLESDKSNRAGLNDFIEGCAALPTRSDWIVEKF